MSSVHHHPFSLLILISVITILRYQDSSPLHFLIASYYPDSSLIHHHHVSSLRLITAILRRCSSSPGTGVFSSPQLITFAFHWQESSSLLITIAFPLQGIIITISHHCSSSPSLLINNTLKLITASPYQDSSSLFHSPLFITTLQGLITITCHTPNSSMVPFTRTHHQYVS